MMKYLVLVLAWLMPGANAAWADDIEAYLRGGALDDVYVNIVMDVGDTELDALLCIVGVDCEPPFMTEAAHRHLRDVYLQGESVTAPGVFKAVIAAVLEDPQFAGFHFSLLIANHANNESTVLSGKKGGGAILSGYRRLRESRTDFVATLKSIPVLSSDNSHEFQPKEIYFEWSRYLRGGEVALGNNTAGNFGLTAPLPNYDSTIVTGGRFLFPFSELEGCSRLYSILFTQGAPSSDEDLNAEIAAQMGLGDRVSFEQLLAHLHGSGTDLVPQWSNEVSLQKTWVVTSRERPGDAAAYAAVSGGAPVQYVNDPVQLQAYLTRVLAETGAVAAGSGTVAFSSDVFQQGRALDNLYLPFFQPRATMSWAGNLKKLKLIDSTPASEAAAPAGGAIYHTVVDVHGVPAIELSGDAAGQIRFDALTFWTDVATLPPGDGEHIPEGADGRIVDRGGAGQKIDGFAAYSTHDGSVAHHSIGDTNSDPAINGYAPRQLFYESGSDAALLPFNADDATLDVLRSLLDPEGELDDEALLTLLKWARGQDTQNGKATARDWLLGAVIHSQPLALNYGATPGYSSLNPNIRLLFGSGEGAFHILENTDYRGNESGREVFAFYPSETLGNIRLHYEDVTPAIQMRYGVDGSPVALKVDKNGDGTIEHTAGDEAFVYFGLRRGGSSYYALDISDPDSVPGLLWKISPTVGGSFDDLGLTFSTPVVGTVNYSGVPVDVLIFAGGYDGGWNSDYTARRGKDAGAADDVVGNAIYIVNARTGELVWKAVRGVTGVRSNTHYQHAGLVDSIPSRVAALRTPDGNIHRLYVGDSGGAVWRVDVPPIQGTNENHRMEQWFVTKLADLGSDEGESGGAPRDDRRFFHAPDTVQSFDDIGDFDGVLIQSGNRANPNETVVANYFFYIKDRETVSGSAAVLARNDVDNPPGKYQFADLADQTTCIVGTEEVTSGEEGPSCSDRSLRNGWKVGFEEPGEKGLSSPLTDGGRVFASTFIPGEADACSLQQGRGQLHVLRLANGTAVANNVRHYDLGEGIPAAAASLGDAVYLPGGGIDLHDLDGDGERDKAKLLPSHAGKLYRVYWREPGIDPL